MTYPRLVQSEQLRLYMVTDDRLCLGRDLMDVVSQAVKGGVTCVQLREKQLPTRDFVTRARALKAFLTPLHIPLVINDRLDVALACDADGVHLGQSDMSADMATPTKTDTHSPWGLEGLRQVRSQTALPLVAIGGIHAGNAADVVLAGADGLAVVSAICAAEAPAAAAEKLLAIASPHFKTVTR